jgi:hypothetical protein
MLHGRSVLYPPHNLYFGRSERAYGLLHIKVVINSQEYFLLPCDFVGMRPASSADQIPHSLCVLAFHFCISLATSNYYLFGLLLVCATNRSLTIHQHLRPLHSLKMVNARPTKELQNVLPKCNPCPHDLLYDWYQSAHISPFP